MKIAISHMRQAATGGTERFLNQIAAELADRGHDVSIICRTHEEAPHPSIKFITLHGWALGRGHRLWRFARDVEKHVTNHNYDLVFGLGRTWSQDVVRVGGGLYADQIRKGLGRKRYWPRDLIAEAIERRTFRAGNYRKVIANSFLTERSLIKKYAIPEDRIVTIHNGVDTSRFNDSYRATTGRELRNQCGFSDENLVYLFLGSGYKRKGLDRLLDAFPDVVAKQPHSRLIIAGHDSSQKLYETQARENGIYEKVAFLGKRNDPEVCFNAADIYVMPTRFDAFGYSAIEALACGLPSIVTDTAGAAEVISEVTGKVIPSAANDFSEQLTNAMLNPPGNASSESFRRETIAGAEQLSLQKTMDKVICTLEEIATLQTPT